MGIVFKMFAGENKDKFPSLQFTLPEQDIQYKNPEISQIYPEYLTDMNVLQCPSHNNGDIKNSNDPSAPFQLTILDLLTGSQQISQLQSQNKVTSNCMVAHLSIPRTYCYFGYATTHGSTARCVFKSMKAYRNIAIAANNFTSLPMDSDGVSCPYDNPKGLIRLNSDPMPDTINFDDSAIKSSVLKASDGTVAEQEAIGYNGSTPIPLNTAYRLKDGIERFLITDINNAAGSNQAQSTIPTMIDVWGTNKGGSLGASGNPTSMAAAIAVNNHVPGGANVAYMDGHVEFIRYQGAAGKYPVCTYSAPYIAKVSEWSGHFPEGVAGY